MNNTLEARKIAIAQALFDSNNEHIIKQIEELLFEGQQDQDDNWKPSKEELQGIKDAMKEVEEGKFISLEEAKQRHKKWLK